MSLINNFCSTFQTLCSAFLGAFYLVVLFFLCFSAVYFIKLNNDKPKHKATTSEIEPKIEAKEQKDVIYYIVEKKQVKKSKPSLTTPKQIHFDE